MTSAVTQVIVWLNALANQLGAWLLAPISVLPGWVSATLVSIITGVVLLWIFKCTSNQAAIKRVRNSIKANLLALKLFQDNTGSVLRSQGRVFLGALRLMMLSLVPMLVMAVPVTLLMTQMALWYQARPLEVGDDAVMTLKLSDNEGQGEHWPNVELQPTSAVEVTTGPVRVLTKREVCWNIRAAENGYHQLVFAVDGRPAEKYLAVGNGFMRVSQLRPSWSWTEVVLHPCEPPFAKDSPVQTVEIDYPERSSWTSGTNSWVVYWLVVSMVAAFCVRPLLGVNI